LDGAVGKVAFSDGGNAEGVREAEGGRRRWLRRFRWKRKVMVVFAQLKLVEVVEGGRPEPGFGSVAVEMVHGRAEAAAGALVDGEDARYDGVAGILVE
jgi:hypothetical protein